MGLVARNETILSQSSIGGWVEPDAASVISKPYLAGKGIVKNHLRRSGTDKNQPTRGCLPRYLLYYEIRTLSSVG